MDTEDNDIFAIVDTSNIVCNAPSLDCTPRWVRIFNNNNLWLVDSIWVDAGGYRTFEMLVILYERRDGRFAATYNNQGTLMKWRQVRVCRRTRVALFREYLRARHVRQEQ